jgi:hypothetical protein
MLMKRNYTKLNPIETPLFPVAERDVASRFHPQRMDIRVLKDDKTVKGTPISSSGVTSTPLSPAAIRVGKVDDRQKLLVVHRCVVSNSKPTR